MAHVRIPDVQVTVALAGSKIFIADFHRVDLSPQDWEVTASLYEADARWAARACLLAAVSQLGADGWEVVDFATESGGEANDQLQLPWE